MASTSQIPTLVFPRLNKNVQMDKAAIWYNKYKNNKIPNAQPCIRLLLEKIHLNVFNKRAAYPPYVLDAGNLIVSCIDHLHCKRKAVLIWFDISTRAICYIFPDGHQGAYVVLFGTVGIDEHFYTAPIVIPGAGYISVVAAAPTHPGPVPQAGGSHVFQPPHPPRSSRSSRLSRQPANRDARPSSRRG